MKMAHKKALSRMIAAAALAGASTCAVAADTIKIAMFFEEMDEEG